MEKRRKGFAAKYERAEYLIAAENERDAEQYARELADDETGRLSHVEYDSDFSAELADAHSCRAEADAYGICQVCGAIVDGTPADYELHGYDPPERTDDND